MHDLVAIPTGRLFGHPLQPRVELGQETVASVREAIALEGGSYPPSMAITVRARDEGGYEILAGHHRAEAARQAKCPAVWAFVRQLGDLEAALFLAASNSHTEMSAFEHGRHAVRLRDDFGVPLADYARRMGRSPAWGAQVATAFQVLDAHGGLDHPYKDLPYTALAAVARVEGHAAQDAVLQEMMGHANPAAIASKLCNAVVAGEPPAAALVRIDRDRRPAAKERVFDSLDGALTPTARPELAAAAMATQWDAEAVEALAFMLEIRTEEQERRRPNLANEREARAFFDLVEARVRAEWPTVKATPPTKKDAKHAPQAS